MIGTGPDVSHFRPADAALATWGLSGSSKYLVVPWNNQYKVDFRLKKVRSPTRNMFHPIF